MKRKAWTTACLDWEQRLIDRKSIIPKPIFPKEAERALGIFKSLKVVDLGSPAPTFGECSDQWVFDFVSAIFGAYDSETGQQLIREYGLLISKKNTKSTIAAGIMLTALILCWRQDEEHLILAPTKEVADNSFKPAAAMVRADPELSSIFNIQNNVRTITHLGNGNSLKVVAADTSTVSGKKAGRVLVDELWDFGKEANAEAMFTEALGGQVSRDEGWVIYLTTQSDQPPAGVFKKRLEYWRAVRDGRIVDPKTLGVLYEYPKKLLEQKSYMDPAFFYVTNPNLGVSVNGEWISDQLIQKQHETDGSFQQFIAKHLNVEIGLNLRSDRWTGADFWEGAGTGPITLTHLMERCEVIVFGIDGGGLDDLLGLCAIGREKKTRKWLHWAHAWAHKIVLDRRKEIAPRLLDFEKQADLTIVDKPGQDLKELADIICRVRDAKLLPEKDCIGVDAAGIGALVEELNARRFTDQHILAISQGWKLNGAIKTVERMLAGGEMLHGASPLMAWSVSNARVVPVGNAITITKQASGTAKIDPLMATFDAASLMALNPVATKKSLILTVAG